MQTDLDLFNDLPEVGSEYRNLSMHRYAEVVLVSQRRYCWVTVKMFGWHSVYGQHGRITHQANGFYEQEYKLSEFLTRFEAIT